MAYYIGLDVSQKTTAICIVDDKGKTFAEGSALTRPSDSWLGQEPCGSLGDCKSWD